MRHTKTPLLTACILMTGFAIPVHALTGNELLTSVDDAMNIAEDQTFEYDLINEERGKTTKSMTIKVWVKGKRRMTEFLKPADMRGTKALVRSQNQMWVYLPAYKKVRRVASHMTEGGFLGTTFSNEEMSTSRYAEQWTSEISGEDDSTYQLTLTPKSADKEGYGKLIITVIKSNTLPSKIQYYSASGVHLKTEERTGYKCKEKVCIAFQHKMTDHSRGGVATRLVLKKWEVNQGLSDQLFSKRKLQR